MPTGTIFGKHGLPDRPTSHGICPVCGRTTIWVPKSGDIARCYNANCERYHKLWRARLKKSDHVDWCGAALNPFSEACIDYLRADGVGDPLRKLAWDWLVNTRHIRPEIIFDTKIGIVPAGLNVEPFIQAAKEAAVFNPSESKKESVKVEEELARPLRERIPGYVGWLAFFYEDFNGDVVAVNFRKLEKEQDENGRLRNVIRMFNPLGKRGIFNPWLYAGTERVLVCEGEINSLRYMSEVVNVYDTDWRDYVRDNITLGASGGCDTSTLGALLTYYGRTAVIAEDNDKAGAGVTTKVAQGGRKTLHFSFPNKSAGYDLDNFFEDAESSKQALDTLNRHIEGAEAFVRPWSELANELDQIRRGTERYINDKGDEKTRAKPEHLVDHEVVEFSLSQIQARGELFSCVYGYLYTADDKRLIRFQKDAPEMVEMFRQLRLYKTQRHYNLVQQNLENYILCNGTETSIYKLGAMVGDNIYINKGDGKMFRISDNGIEVVANGTDGVLVCDENLRPWPDINLEQLKELESKIGSQGMRIGDTPLSNYLRANWADQSLTPEQFEQLFFTRFMSLWLTNILHLWPIMVGVGEMYSGKSTAFEKFMWLLYPNYESEALPTNKRDFLAAVTNKPIRIFDNVDGVDFEEEGLEDLICKCATGGTQPLAELYKTNVAKEFALRCNLIFTSRSIPYDRSDMARRTIYFPLRRLENEERRDKAWFLQRMEAQRDEMSFEILLRLRLIRQALVANRDKHYVGTSTMLDYELFTLRVADYEGWLPEMVNIWTQYTRSNSERVASRNTLVNQLLPFLGAVGYDNSLINIGREMKPGEIWEGMQKIAKDSGEKLTYPSVISLRRALDKNLEALRTLGCTRVGREEHWRYKFEPSPEWIAEARERYLSITRKREASYAD